MRIYGQARTRKHLIFQIYEIALALHTSCVKCDKTLHGLTENSG